MNYPYIIVKPLPSMYLTKRIVFNSDSDCFQFCDRIDLDLQKELDENGKITKNCLESLLQKLRKISENDGERLCVVLSKHDRVYVQPDGFFRLTNKIMHRFYN